MTQLSMIPMTVTDPVGPARRDIDRGRSRRDEGGPGFDQAFAAAMSMKERESAPADRSAGLERTEAPKRDEPSADPADEAVATATSQGQQPDASTSSPTAEADEPVRKAEAAVPATPAAGLVLAATSGGETPLLSTSPASASIPMAGVTPKTVEAPTGPAGGPIVATAATDLAALVAEVTEAAEIVAVPGAATTPTVTPAVITPAVITPAVTGEVAVIAADGSSPGATTSLPEGAPSAPASPSTEPSSPDDATALGATAAVRTAQRPASQLGAPASTAPTDPEAVAVVDAAAAVARTTTSSSAPEHSDASASGGDTIAPAPTAAAGAGAPATSRLPSTGATAGAETPLRATSEADVPRPATPRLPATHRLALDLGGEGLGPLRVEAFTDQGTLHLSLQAGDRGTTAAIGARLPELRHELESAGLQLGNVDVGHHDQSTGGNREQADIATTERRSSAAAGDRSLITSSTTRTPGRAGATSARGFDLRL
ncbi:MAG: flagellar hook-length control protein FliK [Acidimicrobiia bacterium]